ncbi:MAG: electron transfer flavoprotein subunit alpha/FixB family protein [Betaproteobacteria bacterium]|nr:electron transfer flavoprotein subunit alpha/FixB family protein [Betaproteobacteria bacterium]
MKIDALRIVVLLPFEPAEKRDHNALVASVCELHAAVPGSALHIVQLAPATGLVEARAPASCDGAIWWNAVCPSLAADAPAGTLARLFREALAAQVTGDAQRRLVLLPRGAAGEELAATLAWDFNGESLGRCQRIRVEPESFVGQRAAFGGRVLIDLRTQARCCFATLQQQGSVSPVPQPLPQASVRTIELLTRLEPDHDTQRLESRDAMPRLEGASVVVGGGRGVQGVEGFEWLARVAASLDGALGGSLPTVDAGWIPVSRQIGQSGKFVAPRLYFAVGISGTLQHLAGVSADTTIVALNSDPEAPIFSVAKVGVVGDWRDILPLLAERLEERRRRG